MRAALCFLAVFVLAACGNTIELERTVTPAEARTTRKLTPVSIARGDESIPLPEGSVVEEKSVVVSGAANVMELDALGAVVAVRNAAGEWTEPGETIALRKTDRIVVRGTLTVGDPVPGGGKVVLKRQTGALAFGVLAFGLAYIPALIGGAASNDDHPLAAPIVGPWVNLVTRPACVVDPVVGANCIPDTMARFGSVMSGVFQALGIVFMVAGAPSHAAVEEPPEVDEKEKREKASVQIIPLPNGVGVVGRF